MGDLQSLFDVLEGSTEDKPYGDGHFGGWKSDGEGNPAYAYAPVSGPSAGHWHLVGNDRIIATAHGLGFVQVYDWSRGGRCVNRWNPKRGEYSGGFKFIGSDAGSLCTLADWLPEGATQDLVFGMGYAGKCTCHAGLRIVERIEAPQGDDPLLLSTTTVTNESDRAREVEVTEFWAVNLHQIFPAPLTTRGQDRFWHGVREQINRLFRANASWNAAERVLSVHFACRVPWWASRPEKPALIDYHPKAVFLAALDEAPEDSLAHTADGAHFFGKGGLDNPPGLDGAADGRLFEGRRAFRGRTILALRRKLTLAPGPTQHLDTNFAVCLCTPLFDSRDFP